MDDLAYVVVLNWNGESCIRECLRSVLNQTYSPYRVLVVDNGSTDGSPAVIASEFPEASLIRLPENRHFARGSNVGMQEALKDPQCSYVVTLNNDTCVDPEWLHELVRASQPHAGMTACKMLFMDRTRLINSTGFSSTRRSMYLARPQGPPCTDGSSSRPSACSTRTSWRTTRISTSPGGGALPGGTQGLRLVQSCTTSSPHRSGREGPSRRTCASGTGSGI